MSAKTKMNGSVDLLAQAMRGVFEEAMSSTRAGIKADMLDMENGIKSDMHEMEGRLNTRISNLDT